MPDVRVLNELQIKKDGVVATYRLGTVNGYYNSADGKFYEEATHVTEIEGAPNLVYADIAGNALYIWKTSTSSFVKVSGDGGGGGLVYGYLNSTDGKFYEDSSYTTEIPGDSDKLFITLDDNYIYRYDTTNTEFIQIGGSGGGLSDAIVYVNTLPSSNIQDVIYGMVTEISRTTTVTTDFLDSESMFEKETTGGGYYYTPADDLEIEVSTDGTTYKKVSQVLYDNGSPNNFMITYADATYEGIAYDSPFYYKQITRDYYAGNSTDQTLTPFNGGSGGGGTTYYAGTGIDITGSIISAAPASITDIGGVKPDNSTIVVDANGTISGNYQAGHGIVISGNEISDKTFVGTQAEWDALTPAQQAEYDIISITDDGAPINLISGHTIKDGTDTGYTQRTNLKFNDVTIADDSTNDVTIVTPTPYTAGDKIDITNHVVSTDETVKGTFIGTKAEWAAVPSADKAKYEIVNLTDDEVNPITIVDSVTDGNMNPVTSNAVYDNLINKVDLDNFTRTFRGSTSSGLTTNEIDLSSISLFGATDITFLLIIVRRSSGSFPSTNGIGFLFIPQNTSSAPVIKPISGLSGVTANFNATTKKLTVTCTDYCNVRLFYI
jgi:hypothetical protein